MEKNLNITPSLAWLVHQGDDIVPIPGWRKQERVAKNAAAANVRLSPAVLNR